MLGKGKAKGGGDTPPKEKPAKPPKPAGKGGGLSLFKKAPKEPAGEAPAAPAKPAAPPGEKKGPFGLKLPAFGKPKPKAEKPAAPTQPAAAPQPASAQAPPTGKKGPFGLKLPAFGKPKAAAPKEKAAPAEGEKKPANITQLATILALLLVLAGISQGKRLLRIFIHDKTEETVGQIKDSLGGPPPPGGAPPPASGSAPVSAGAPVAGSPPPPKTPAPAPTPAIASPSATPPPGVAPPGPPTGAPPPGASVASAPAPAAPAAPPGGPKKEAAKSDYQLFLEAIKKADVDRVKELISEGRNVNAKDTAGRTPLLVSLLFGEDDLDQEEITLLLLDQGADPNVKVPPFGAPLNLAVENGNKVLVDKLLAKGADVESEDGEGYTPLMRAAQLNHDKIAFALRKKGARDKPRPKKAEAAPGAASGSAPTPPPPPVP